MEWGPTTPRGALVCCDFGHLVLCNLHNRVSKIPGPVFGLLVHVAQKNRIFPAFTLFFERLYQIVGLNYSINDCFANS